MEEVFDTYTRKTKIHYILLSIYALTCIPILWKFMGAIISQKYDTLIMVSFVICLITAITYMVLSATHLVKMYEKDGEMILSSESISIKSIKIPWQDIKKIEISANDYRGAKSSDGSGNRIRVIENSGMAYHCRFVISSITQRNNLKGIIEGFKSQGITIDTIGWS